MDWKEYLHAVKSLTNDSALPHLPERLAQFADRLTPVAGFREHVSLRIRSTVTRYVALGYCLLIVAAFLGSGRGAAARGPADNPDSRAAEKDARGRASIASEDAWIARQIN
ncbi:MAG TPA: hypothetical protein VI756_07730, partial [Blastocatellia bacterium]